MAANKETSTGLITPAAASLYRNELATGKSTRYAGKDLPREERELNQEEKDHRQKKLAEYDARVKSSRRKWKTTMAIKKDTEAILADTTAIKSETAAIKAGVAEAKDEIISSIKSETVPLRKDEKIWIEQLSPLPVSVLNGMLTDQCIDAKGNKIQKILILVSNTSL